MYEKNGLAKQNWQSIVIMKDFLLINSNFLPEFWAEAIDTANYLQNQLSTKSQRGEIIPKDT